MKGTKKEEGREDATFTATQKDKRHKSITPPKQKKIHFQMQPMLHLGMTINKQRKYYSNEESMKQVTEGAQTNRIKVNSMLALSYPLVAQNFRVIFYGYVSLCMDGGPSSERKGEISITKKKTTMPLNILNIQDPIPIAAQCYQYNNKMLLQTENIAPQKKVKIQQKVRRLIVLQLSS